MIFSQGNFNLKKGLKESKIKFKLINNLIVLPVEINGVELSFLLDTGVSKPIIFNFLNVTDTLQIKNTEKIFLRGLGEGDYVEAYKSKNNLLKIGSAINIDQDLYAVFDSSLNFAPKLGVPIHGIIGYDLFKDFAIEINYSKKRIKLIDRKHLKYKKYKNYENLKLNFYNNKPYMDAIFDEGSEKIPIRLLIDTGGSDALWLFESNEIRVSNNYFEDFLGKGLSGGIFGKRSKIKGLKIGSYTFNNVNVAYPDSSSIQGTKKYKARNGSISGEVLKRFNILINYSDSSMFIKKNSNFKLPFYYNKSGITLEHNGVRLVKESQNVFNNIVANDANSGNSNAKIILETSYNYLLSPAYNIVELRKDSPAYRAGLKLGDIILTIDNIDAHKLSLQEITQKFFNENGKVIRLKIDRDGKFLDFKFQLEDILKKPR